MQYANSFRRFIAFIIDYFILSFVLGIFNTIGFTLFFAMNKEFMQYANANRNIPDALVNQALVSGLVIFAVLMITGLLVYWLYSAYFESSKSQATPGKMVLSLKVVDENGQRISFARASGRFVGKFLTSIIWILFVVILCNDKKQALHDMAAKTYVVEAN
ncbi:putative membrane protein YckC [Parelusimicrobium proximum]|uniref:RDD family protein n=1 Tax=Parelusimicrobium proximum TaxID=3228953 RepID=UPI003D167B93